jgi:parallel beta-helix repeat protein
VDDLPITFFDPPGASRRDVASIEELREAIQSEPAGAIVHLRAGMYLVTESIEVARDDLTIEGEGDLTVLILAGHVNAPMFVLGDPTEVGPVTHRGLVLARMRLSGNRTQQDFELATSPGRGHLTNSCVIVREAENVVVQDVIVEGCRSAGVLLEERCRNVQLLRIDAFDNEVDGIAWDGDVQNSRLSGSTLRDNGYGGLSFDLGPSSNLVDRCHIFGNARVGVFLSNSDDNVFRENVIERNGEDGVYIRDGNQKFQPGSISTDNLFLENQILFNLRNGVWQGGFGSTGNRVSGGIVGCNGDAPLVSADPSAAPLLVDADVAVYAPEDAPELCSTLQ